VLDDVCALTPWACGIGVPGPRFDQSLDRATTIAAVVAAAAVSAAVVGAVGAVFLWALPGEGRRCPSLGCRLTARGCDSFPSAQAAAAACIPPRRLAPAAAVARYHCLPVGEECRRPARRPWPPIQPPPRVSTNAGGPTGTARTRRVGRAADADSDADSDAGIRGQRGAARAPRL
jgi:hypothetical protein